MFEMTSDDIVNNTLEIKGKEYILVSNQLYQIINVKNFFVSFVNEIFGFFGMGKWYTHELKLEDKKIILVRVENNTIRNYFKLSMIDKDVNKYFSDVQKKWMNKCEILLNLLNISIEDKILVTNVDKNIELKLDLSNIKHIANYNKHSFNYSEYYKENILFNLMDIISTINDNIFEKLDDCDEDQEFLYESLFKIKSILNKINSRFDFEFSIIVEEFSKNFIIMCENFIY